MGAILTREFRRIPETWWETVCRICAASQLPVAPVLGDKGVGRFTIGGEIGGHLYLLPDMVTGWAVGQIRANAWIARDKHFRTGSSSSYTIAFRHMATEMVDLHIQAIEACTDEFSRAHKRRGSVELVGSVLY